MDSPLVFTSEVNVKEVVDSLLPDGESSLPLPSLHLTTLQLPPKLTSAPMYTSSPSVELSLSHAALVQSRLRTQLRETRDEIAYLRQELEKDQSSNRIQIIQELIVVSLRLLSFPSKYPSSKQASRKL